MKVILRFLKNKAIEIGRFAVIVVSCLIAMCLFIIGLDIIESIVLKDFTMQYAHNWGKVLLIVSLVFTCVVLLIFFYCYSHFDSEMVERKLAKS